MHECSTKTRLSWGPTGRRSGVDQDQYEMEKSPLPYRCPIISQFLRLSKLFMKILSLARFAAVGRILLSDSSGRNLQSLRCVDGFQGARSLRVLKTLNPEMDGQGDSSNNCSSRALLLKRICGVIPGLLFQMSIGGRLLSGSVHRRAVISSTPADAEWTDSGVSRPPRPGGTRGRHDSRGGRVAWCEKNL
jgi:hypothetical protein